MGISLQPCKVTMPLQNGGCRTVLEFLIQRFPRIDADIWRQRIADDKVHWDDGTLVRKDSGYLPQGRIFYYREVEEEPEIPFVEEIIYQDAEIIVAFKPHFLPVNPMGKYVRQSLVHRLMERTGIRTLAPLHRIDRETAGLVMLSVNPESRDSYHQLFRERGRIRKTYRALAHITEDQCPEPGQQWRVENRMVEGEPWFRMQTESGEINARSEIRCLAVHGTKKDVGLFELSPLTGKTHQLRLHMSGLGFPLVNDRLYPVLQPQSADDFQAPLQLFACRLAFVDPVADVERIFEMPSTFGVDHVAVF